MKTKYRQKIRHSKEGTGAKLKIVLIAAFTIVYVVSMLTVTWIDQLANRNDYAAYAGKMENQIWNELHNDFGETESNEAAGTENQEERLSAMLASYAALYSTKYQMVSVAAYNGDGYLLMQSADLLTAGINDGEQTLLKSWPIADYLDNRTLEKLARYEAENHKPHDYGGIPYEFIAGYSESDAELTSVSVRRLYYSTDDMEEGQAEGTEVLWQKGLDTVTEQKTVGELWLPCIQTGGTDAWHAWENDEYLHGFPQNYVRSSHEEWEESRGVIHRESSTDIYLGAVSGKADYTVVIRSAEFPWQEAFDSLKHIYVWGAVLAVACAGGVLYIVEQTFRKRRLLEERQRNYANAIAHEMKTPLAVIRGFAENLETDTNSGKRQYYLKHIIDQTDRLDNMVKELIFVSILDSEKYRPQKRKISVRDLIEEIEMEQSTRIEEKSIDLCVRCSGDFIIDGERRFLKKAFTCLMDNAISHNLNEGRIKIDIEKDKCVIENTGTKIPEDQLPHVCEIFYTLSQKEQGKNDHFGLGLYLAERIFRIHGLRLKIENTESGVRAVAERK